MLKRIILLSILAMTPYPAAASDWAVTARVSQIEISYLPEVIPIYIDRAAGSCPVGTPLYWTPRGNDVASRIANAQAILSGMMTAKSMSSDILIVGDKNGCKIEFIYLK